MTNAGDPETEETEAEAQREETVMPWVWGGIGIIAVIGFAAWLALWPAVSHLRQPAAAAPISVKNPPPR